jgi:hypothetical protein
MGIFMELNRLLALYHLNHLSSQGNFGYFRRTTYIVVEKLFVQNEDDSKRFYCIFQILVLLATISD